MTKMTAGKLLKVNKRYSVEINTEIHSVLQKNLPCYTIEMI